MTSLKVFKRKRLLARLKELQKQAYPKGSRVYEIRNGKIMELKGKTVISVEEVN